MSDYLSIDRRRFVGVALISVLVSGAGVRLAVSPNGGERYIRSVLKRKMPYLMYDDSVVQQFCDDLLSYRLDDDSKFTVLRAVGHPLSVAIAQLHAPTHDRLEAFEQTICGLFLQSTDFFFEGEQPDRLLMYVSYADPYKNGCVNPVAVLA